MPPKKSKKNETPPPVANQGKKNTGRKHIVKSGNVGNNTKNANDDQQPSEKKSIFGDWTGKVPVSLLHEHCQKQGWEKPTFDMARRKQGFIGTVRLGKRNKKTAQIQTVTLTPPQDLCLPTAIEARHLAATFALHRINSHMPMYRILPPQHRDYWQQFERLKTKDNAWQYVPDPFGVQPPAPSTKSSSAMDRRPVRESANAAIPLSQQQASRLKADQLEDDDDDNNRNKRRAGNTALDEKLRKYWESLPAVHMSSENRELVEDVVKKSNIVYQPVGTTIAAEERKEIEEGLVRMGFRPSHVDEALEYCSDMAMALDWLCLHVPEDDLPPTFMHANYKPTMTTISHTTQSLGRDWLIKRMTGFGYPANICQEAMEQCQNDDLKALGLLQWRLAHGDEPMPTSTQQEEALAVDAEELETIWQEEAVALESIYGSNFEKLLTEEDKQKRLQFRISLHANITHRGKTRQVPVILESTFAKDSQYPNTLPIFTVVCDKLPSYLKLSLIKGVIAEAEKNLGLPMVYMCAEWLQEHVDDYIANPPKLRDITEGIASIVALPQSSSAQKKKRRKNGAEERRNRLSKEDHAKISQQLKDDLHTMRASDAYAPLGKVRSKLPAESFQPKVVQAVLENQVSIVCGETGCGKTTQVPQFILDTEIENNRGSTCNIICTQPRKVAAIGVAERVAAERCEKIGGSVGYAVRGETKASSQTRLQFVTTGVLLRRLHSDPSLGGISHVLIDEVHERSVDSDFLLIILRQVLKKRKDLKVVLMSATINQQVFADYFGGAPAIEIPGFTHPVKDYYLEDVISMTSYVSRLPMPKQVDKGEKGSQWAQWQLQLLDEGYDEQTVQTMARYRNQDKIDYDLITHVVKHIVENGTVRIDHGAQPAILVFMPGAMEIRRCVEALQGALLPRSSATERYAILPLHANLSPQEQTSVFKKVSPEVCKIVVATNVAETSITIDGVVYVIDAGRVKETQYDPSNSMMRLVETWASRASCKQRRGRAGRTRPGECYKIFSRDTEARKMHAQQVPELLRTPLEQLCLQVKSMGEFDVKSFLGNAIDPPSVAALESAIRTLQAVDAIETSPRGELTPLGKHMASIPADLRIGKMLLMGSIFSCLDSILTIASIMSLKSPFTAPMERREEARQCRERFALGSKSDWITDMNAYERWHQIVKGGGKGGGMREARRFCEENFLSFATLSEIGSLRRQYADALADIGFYDRRCGDAYNRNHGNVNLVKSIVFGGLNPNVAKIRMPDAKYDKVLSGTVEREKEAREIKFFTKEDGRVFLHPSSILFGCNSYNSSFLTYFSRIETSKVFIRDGMEVPSYAVLFFGGRVDIDHFGRGLKVGQDGWIKFRAWARIGVLVNQLKRLLHAELDSKIQDPGIDVSASRVVQTMISLITNNGV
ncbi:P-loop containing nucleoside triphosphate hydrolase protein [Zychaea mexicana]|uniref:P-loop containing nucleoside triphosphate hydrolase protein n=1 Tax=Zychaea mexicana TaxID=64656 RepID=UPI0022FDC0E8|nr:P-loop containing nucleoside triphosphate hydrolase protein [Zychaea mexicana]KAI9482586.1 P-loop containing nucleoside triphosphate hydrolase protein [Zychaea mexicana]